MSSRRDFLNAGALAALAPTIAATPAPLPSPSSKPSPEPSFPPLAFDLAGFDAATSKPAQHRHMFASRTLDGGLVLDAIQTTLNAYASIGTTVSSVATAAVLYHGLSIMLAFDDAIWRDLLVPVAAKLPGAAKTDFAKYTNAKGNPFRKPGSPDDPSMAGLAAGGTLFFVCNYAARGFAEFMAHANGLAPAAVYDRMSKNMLPGASLVPAGVWAVHALQDRHYTYEQVTM
ncbi:MAG TPA: hypothetical protein VMF61_11950 [Candidatus Acidoferrales bacterium]|nr:hypothetical protein [Candidatus Acidoferrales bacterium]